MAMGFTSQLNETATLDAIGGTPLYAAAPPLLLVALAATQLTAPRSAWPAALAAGLAVVVAFAGSDPAAVCAVGPGMCILYAAWAGSALGACALLTLGLVRDTGSAPLVREAALVHALMWAVLWAPARAGAYGAATTPALAAQLDVGIVEALRGDYAGGDSQAVAWGRAATLALQSTAAVAAAQVAAPRHPARAAPWIGAGLLMLAAAVGVPYIDYAQRDERTLYADGYACDVRHPHLACERGVFADDCTVGVWRLGAVAALVAYLAGLRRVAELAEARPWAGQPAAVLYAALGVAAAHAALVLVLEAGPASVDDRRAAHNGPCSPWGTYSAHLLASAAVALGVGPALAALPFGTEVRDVRTEPVTVRERELRLEPITVGAAP